MRIHLGTVVTVRGRPNPGTGDSVRLRLKLVETEQLRVFQRVISARPSHDVTHDAEVASSVASPVGSGSARHHAAAEDDQSDPNCENLTIKRLVTRSRAQVKQDSTFIFEVVSWSGMDKVPKRECATSTRRNRSKKSNGQ